MNPTSSLGDSRVPLAAYPRRTGNQSSFTLPINHRPYEAFNVERRGEEVNGDDRSDSSHSLIEDNGNRTDDDDGGEEDEAEVDADRAQSENNEQADDSDVPELVQSESSNSVPESHPNESPVQVFTGSKNSQQSK